jgi:UDP-N-acetylglucosamine/UDP-N-acetylgalactosamine 4-epimerase
MIDAALQDAARERRWLVTGAAGFIGSHLVEALLRGGCRVTALDNLSTGHLHNLEDVKQRCGDEAWARLSWMQGDVTNFADCRAACEKADVVLHQAALGSVPRSLLHPEATTAANVGGFVNMLTAAKESGIQRVVYASSSSVYGDSPLLPKQECHTGNPLSPYALSKWVNEEYAAVFARCYSMECVGLRYFNVFGPRQDPHGAYAAVIPAWFDAMRRGEPIQINGDGETSRDFCYVANVVQANLRAALIENPAALNRAYNIACGERTTLNQLAAGIAAAISELRPDLAAAPQIQFRNFRAGDIQHSLADISAASEALHYEPTHRISDGLRLTAAFYLSQS